MYIIEFLFVDDFVTVGTACSEKIGEPSGVALLTFEFVLDKFSDVNSLLHALLMMSVAPADG